jgi:hypothetical protein
MMGGVFARLIIFDERLPATIPVFLQYGLTRTNLILNRRN